MSAQGVVDKPRESTQKNKAGKRLALLRQRHDRIQRRKEAVERQIAQQIAESDFEA